MSTSDLSDPRGIVVASTAASFSAPLVALGIGGANRLLTATFLVIAGTVAIYGLAAAPLADVLGLREPEPDKSPHGTPGPGEAGLAAEVWSSGMGDAFDRERPPAWSDGELRSGMVHRPRGAGRV